jgi:hypothetical protein
MILTPHILVWWDHAFWKKEKNCSEKEVAKIKHLTPDIDVLNARNMITLTSSRTGNSRRNRCIYSTRECAFLFLLHKPRITKRKNAFKDKKRKEKQTRTHARTQTLLVSWKGKKTRFLTWQQPEIENGIACPRQNVRMAPGKLATHAAAQRPDQPPAAAEE